MTNRSTEICTDASSEISNYLSQPYLPEDSDPLAYWKGKQMEFPHLAQLACKHLAIPASSALVERLFSVAGKVFRPELCNLSDAKFEELMIRCNRIDK
ncbi:UNVERIFIED_CONTAM: hypothetical protein FKN15_037013 [Acipenser sinensis]